LKTNEQVSSIKSKIKSKLTLSTQHDEKAPGKESKTEKVPSLSPGRGTLTNK